MAKFTPAPDFEVFCMGLEPLEPQDPLDTLSLGQNTQYLSYDSDVEEGMLAMDEPINEPMEGLGTEEESTDLVEELAESEPVKEEEGSSSLAAEIERLTLVGPHDDGTLSENAARKKKGRKTNPETFLLAKFRNNKQHKGAANAPKKEYLRVKVIRGLKRAIREVTSGKSPSRKKLHHPTPSASIQWTIFSDFIIANSAFPRLAATYEGPATEGKTYRIAANDKYRCYNNQCCKDFFDSQLVRQAYYLYLELIFANAEDRDLAEKFGFTAIGKSKEERMAAWSELRSYLSVTLLAELEESGGFR